MVWALRSFPLLRYAHGCLIPPCCCGCPGIGFLAWSCACCNPAIFESAPAILRSEEHTSELQSHSDLVCRLLLEKKKTTDHLGEGARELAQAIDDEGYRPDIALAIARRGLLVGGAVDYALGVSTTFAMTVELHSR